ncbi:hypothetical protein AB0M47_36765 [Hamadaea sp. NPDC051192]|uniref:hypothetical protein n=1 Tax=Hamadaea sp. NPDC051192 TaxID=3154940 RepID=UPI00341C5AC1
MTTYYWDSVSLDAAELEVARAELVKPSSDATFVDAFLKLLRSEQRVPVSVALARFQYAEAESRWGGGNPCEPYEMEVLDRARWVLRQPPLTAAESGARRDGADHASALLAMTNLAQPEDAELIADVMDRTTDPEVLSNATAAASKPLEQADKPNPRLVEVIGRIAMDDSQDRRTRAEVMEALRFAHCAEGADIAMRFTESDDVQLQVSAASVLATAHLATHREVVERLMASWPQDTPGAYYPRMLLEDADEE